MSQRKMKMTDERKQVFLDHLRQHGLVIQAAKAASPGSPIGCQQSFYDERGRNPEFAAAWEQAIEDSEEALLAELKRRGIDGYEEDVYGSLGPGQGTGIVGRKTVFSDKMAELYARVKSARIRQGLANKVELSGSVKHEGQMDLSSLSPEKQALLDKLLSPDDDSPE